MLTKRTHILFDENVWKKLGKLAETKKTSIGELVRSAVAEKYADEYQLERRRKAVDAILRDRPKPIKGKLDYKTLVNSGRKYY